MSKDSCYRCDAFIGVHEGKLVYVQVDSKEAFDAIDLPGAEHDNGCISKAQKTEALHIVFQFWGNKREGIK